MKKTSFLIFGLVAYITFWATFCYAVGFVSMLMVPKHIDGLPRAPLGFAFLVNAVLILNLVLLWNVLAIPAVKQRFKKFVPQPLERSSYMLLTCFCLMLLFWLWKPMGGFIWDVDSEFANVLLTALCLSGFGIVLISTFLGDHFELFGLRQVWFYFTGKKYSPHPFRTRLFYKRVRHPMYLGLMIASWVTPVMTVAHLFLSIITTAYMFSTIRPEENAMAKKIGSRYLDSKRAAPILIPFTKIFVRK